MPPCVRLSIPGFQDRLGINQPASSISIIIPTTVLRQNDGHSGTGYGSYTERCCSMGARVTIIGRSIYVAINFQHKPQYHQYLVLQGVAELKPGVDAY